MGTLREVWIAVVGADAARHSTPLRRTRAGVVTVACVDGMWAQELDYRHDELLVAVQREAPGVRVSRLRFAVSASAVHAPPREEEPARPVTPPGKSAKSAARQLTKGVGDTRLRDLLERAAAHGFERNQRRQK